MKNNKKLIKILALIIVILIVFGAVIYLNDNSKSNISNKSNHIENEDKEINGNPTESEDKGINGNPIENEDNELNGNLTDYEESTEEKNLIKIETKYCDLYYPLKWEEIISIEKEEKNEFYVVHFKGTINENKSMYLFDIVFGDGKGVLIGYINYENEKTPIYVISSELEFSDNWTENEKTIICSMQEDINYVIESLRNEVGYRAP